MGEIDDEDDDSRNIENMTERGDRKTEEKTGDDGEETRLGILRTTNIGVGDKEGRRTRRRTSRIWKKTEELNQNRTLDQNRD